MGQDVRPVRDDIGYCWHESQLERFMQFLKQHPQEQNRTTATKIPALIAGISPHDDYLYAGKAYYQLFQHIHAPEVVILGVTHRPVRVKFKDPHNKIIFDNYTHWKGPYGKITVSPLRDYLKNHLDSSFYMVSNEAHRMEHSIEGMLPFLQYAKRDVRITPIMITGMPFEKMDEVSGKLANALVTYIKEKNLILGKDIFFLISADANHYGKDFDNIVFGEDAQAHKKGTDFDKKLAHSFLAGNVDPTKINELTRQLWGKSFTGYGDTLWCGKFSIPFGMLTMNHLIKNLHPQKQLKGKILYYGDTYSDGVLPIQKTGMGITATFSLKHWVGFFSAGFYL
jgi:MEMO1 family protein